MTAVSFCCWLGSKLSTLPSQGILTVIMFTSRPLAPCLLTQTVVRYGSINAINIGETYSEILHVVTKAQLC